MSDIDGAWFVCVDRESGQLVRSWPDDAEGSADHLFGGPGRAIVKVAPVRPMRERAEQAEAERDRLREALRFYADPDNYDDEGAPGEWLTIPSNPSNGGEEYDFDPDGGERARAALTSRAEEGK